ncbi:MAG: hypothetical protein H0U76_27815 [Ktedonobacteraceae bacterium]|nr:hypothetical protein [Ktedonobacteraceae bacterium]
MDPIATTVTEFAVPIRNLLAQDQELLVLCRYANRGGNAYDWWLIRTDAELHTILATAPFQASISVFLEPELPLRGIANPTLLERALQLLEAEGEILVACLPEDGNQLENVSGADEVADLIKWFHDYEGTRAAIGRYPPFWLRNGSSVVITGYVPDAHGIVRMGSF